VTNETANITRIRLEQRQDDERTIADLALKGEQAACAARLAMLMTMGVATALAPILGVQSGVRDPIQLLLIVAYVMFTVVFWLTLRRSKPSIRAGRVMPFAFMAVDFLFIVGQGWRISANGGERMPFVPALMLAVFVCFNVARHSRWHAITSTVAAIVTFAVAGQITGGLPIRGVLMASGAYVVIGALTVWVNGRVRQSWVDVRRRENLAHFLPRQVVDRVLSQGGRSLQPVQREVTVLFSDIRDFTAMSEAMSPQEVLALLDDYFGQMAQIVKGHDGMVNKFIGDGMLAVWGVPDAMEDHAVKAVKSAIDMRKRLVEMNEHRIGKQGQPPLRIGIGIHSGPVAAGMLGGADQHEYTVIGDAVNLASRIEGLTKQLGADLLVSERTWTLANGRFEGSRVSEEKVKGRAAAVVVYAVDAVKSG
jgi:adenylate cyclase